MRLTERAREVVDLLDQPRLTARRLARPIAVLKALAASEQELLLPLADRRLRHTVTRAASACVLSPCNTDNTIFNLTSAGCFGGLATEMLLTIGGPAGLHARVLTQPASLALRASPRRLVSTRRQRPTGLN